MFLVQRVAVRWVPPITSLYEQDNDNPFQTKTLAEATQCYTEKLFRGNQDLMVRRSVS